jgi:Flp pilus assembly protein TadG
MSQSSTVQPLVAFCPARRRRHAVTTAEMAICLPVLFLFFFASVEFGRLNMLRHAAAEAAYEGARRGISPGATVADVRTSAADMLSTAWATGYTINVTPSTIAPETPQVTVSVSIPFGANSLLPPTFFGGNSTAASSCTLQREKYATAAP